MYIKKISVVKSSNYRSSSLKEKMKSAIFLRRICRVSNLLKKTADLSQRTADFFQRSSYRRKSTRYTSSTCIEERSFASCLFLDP